MSLTDQPTVLALLIIAAAAAVLFAISKYKRMKFKMHLPHATAELSGDMGRTVDRTAQSTSGQVTTTIAGQVDASAIRTAGGNILESRPSGSSPKNTRVETSIKGGVKKSDVRTAGGDIQVPPSDKP